MNKKETKWDISSPNKKYKAYFWQSMDGTLFYSLLYKKDSIITKSALGFSLEEDNKEVKYTTDFIVENGIKDKGTEKYELPWGETRQIKADFEHLTFQVRHKTGLLFEIESKLFDDGLGFRYNFPKQKRKKINILEEHTYFNLKEDVDISWQPGDWNSYENRYYNTKLSEINAQQYDDASQLISRVIPNNAVATPATMKKKNGIYISIHEAQLVNYPGMTLGVDTKKHGFKTILTGTKRRKAKAVVSLPFRTPWRIILIEERAIDLVNNKLALNLNAPNKLGDVSWFKPKKYVGVWWEMFLGKGTWDYASGKHAATTKNVKKYIDFASKHGVTGILVEGWNTGWEVWTDDKKRETAFDFVTSYPDYNIKEVVAYGKSKNVELILHHETSAVVEQYEKSMDNAFKLMQSLGLHSVKSGYVGNIVPRGEYHHGQYMVNHYQKVWETAAKYQVAVNPHEPIKATGMRRTYPNMIAREGSLGQEYNAFGDTLAVNPVYHIPTLVYTRCLSGPFDYTPGIFNLKLKPWKPEGWEILSTISQQLALYVVIYSPIQMLADLPEHYEKHPEALKFIEDVGVDWERTVPLEGELGQYAVIAREEKNTQNWFIGGVNGEKNRTVNFDLSFLPLGGKYKMKIYKDASDTHYINNKTKLDISEKTVSKTEKLSVEMKKGGGFAISLHKI